MLQIVFWTFAISLFTAALAGVGIIFGWWLPALIVVGGVLNAWHVSMREARARRIARLLHQKR